MKDVQFRHKYSVGVCGGPRGIYQINVLMKTKSNRHRHTME